MSELARLIEPEYRVLPKPSDRWAWLQARHGYYNASDAGCLFDCHPFRALGDVAVDKLRPEADDDEPTEAMTRGMALEPALLAWWGDRHGVAVATPAVLYVRDRLMATLDGLPLGSDEDGVEAKTAREYIDDVKPHWWWQAQAQMATVPTLRRVHFPVLDGSMRLKEFTVERDEGAIDRLMERVEWFWSFIDLGMTPEGVVLSYEDTRRLYPVADPEEAVDLPDDAADVLARLRAATAARKAAEADEAEAKAWLCERLGTAAVGRLGGDDVVTWRSQSRRDIDTKGLVAHLEAEQQLELLDRFRRTSSFRVLRVKEQGE